MCLFLFGENYFTIPDFSLQIFLPLNFRMTAIIFVYLYPIEIKAKPEFPHFSFTKLKSVF
jgi:hypothetical protein